MGTAATVAVPPCPAVSSAGIVTTYGRRPSSTTPTTNPGGVRRCRSENQPIRAAGRALDRQATIKEQNTNLRMDAADGWVDGMDLGGTETTVFGYFPCTRRRGGGGVSRDLSRGFNFRPFFFLPNLVVHQAKGRSPHDSIIPPPLLPPVGMAPGGACPSPAAPSSSALSSGARDSSSSASTESCVSRFRSAGARHLVRQGHGIASNYVRFGVV